MEIQIILRRLGVCTTYKGYKALVLAITLALEDENRLNSITREIYNEVAHQLDSTPSAIEKNLRTVVQRAWRMNPKDLEKWQDISWNICRAFLNSWIFFLITYSEAVFTEKNRSCHRSATAQKYKYIRI